MNNATIEALPMEGRNVPYLLSRATWSALPGTQTSTRISIAAAELWPVRALTNGNVTLDGVDNNDQVNGYAFTGGSAFNAGLGG